jgi:TonB family protein
MRAREVQERTSAQPGLRSAIIKSAIAHVCIFFLISISPGFDLPLKEKPVDVVWVELPKGTSDEIGWGIAPSPGLPGTTIEQQRQIGEPVQEPMEAVPKEPREPREESMQVAEKQAKPVIEKTVTARPSMTYQKKGAPRRRRATRTDRKISDALAMIDRSLSERATAPESAQMGTRADGYKYGTGTRPLRVPPSDPEYLKYQAQVRAKIIGKWMVPESVIATGKGASARLIVMINMNGEVISIRWSKKSGMPSFDQSAKRAVENASPFPNPPQRLAWETYNEGFLIEFDARAR